MAEMNKQTVHKAHKHIIGNRIKSIRLELGDTLEEFGLRIARVLNVQSSKAPNKSLVSRWENDLNLPNKERLKVIAELGNITVEELLYQDNQKKEVGTRIKMIRNSRGETQEEFGNHFEAHKSIISKWENGKSLPSSERLSILSDISGIPVEELLYGDTYFKKLEMIKDLVNQAYEQIDKAHINIEKENKRIEKITLNLAEIKEIIINDLENN